MQAHMRLKVKPIGDSRVQSRPEKKQGRFGFISRFLGKSVKYYTDEELRRVGVPYLWTQ